MPYKKCVKDETNLISKVFSYLLMSVDNNYHVVNVIKCLPIL